MKRWTWFFVLFAIVLFGPTVLAQVASQAAGEAATPHSSSSELGNGVIWAFLSTSFMEWFKRNPKMSFLSQRTAFWGQRAVGVLLAVATALGIHASFDAATGVLTVTGLIWNSVQEAFGESLRQFCFNEICYRTTVKNYKGKEASV